MKDRCPPTGTYLWVDVRDVALAHALAVEKAEAANKRIFITAGRFSNREIVEIIADAFPQLRDKLPTGDLLKLGEYPPGGWYGYDDELSRVVLGLAYRTLKESIIDTVKSLQAVLSK